ncbi:MAG: response regulator transcription factor [Chloroflexi bacterium]|nr:response regulator transcription factor [Chloroflexota bacterium]
MNASLRTRPLKVVLVEDHHIMRRGLGSLLTTERDVQIAGEAACGEEALALLRSSDLPDLIIMDVSLPGIDGIETTRRVRSLYPQVKVLILSMYNNPTFVHQAMQAGAAGYILKQSMVEELNIALDLIAQGKQFISPMVTANLDPTAEFKPGLLESLTNREIEVFERLAKGMSVKDIAEDLVVSIYTVYTHMNTIKRKLGIEKTADLMRYAIENPLILKPSRQE